MNFNFKSFSINHIFFSISICTDYLALKPYIEWKQLLKKKHKMGLQSELPPLRSLDDFILGSARFQMPNVDDLDKWGNRVTKNLLYYQTNYFLMGTLVWILFALYNPMQTILGIIAITSVIFALIIINPARVQGQPQQEHFAGPVGWLYLGAIGSIVYFVLYMFQSLLYVGLITLLPFCMAFVHSSFRLRNLKNKLSNAIDEKLRYTPMGVFMEAMSIAVDSITK